MTKYLTYVLAALMLFSSGAIADGDHEAARRLREEGRIVPLEVILERVKSAYDGTLLEVELERQGKAKWVYEVEMVDSKGEVRELLFDAETGESMGREGDHGRAAD